jgi:hypothetical protein
VWVSIFIRFNMPIFTETEPVRNAIVAALPGLRTLLEGLSSFDPLPGETYGGLFDAGTFGNVKLAIANLESLLRQSDQLTPEAHADGDSYDPDKPRRRGESRAQTLQRYAIELDEIRTKLSESGFRDTTIYLQLRNGAANMRLLADPPPPARPFTPSTDLWDIGQRA